MRNNDNEKPTERYLPKSERDEVMKARRLPKHIGGRYGNVFQDAKKRAAKDLDPKSVNADPKDWQLPGQDEMERPDPFVG